MVRDRAPLGQTQAKEMSLTELKKSCDEREGDSGIDTPQNGESERQKLTVCVQDNWGTGTLNPSDMSNQVTESWSAWAGIAIGSHPKNILHYYLPASKGACLGSDSMFIMFRLIILLAGSLMF